MHGEAMRVRQGDACSLLRRSGSGSAWPSSRHSASAGCARNMVNSRPTSSGRATCSTAQAVCEAGLHAHSVAATPNCPTLTPLRKTERRLHITRSGCVMGCILSCSILRLRASNSSLQDAQPHLRRLRGRRHEAAGRVGALAACQTLEGARVVAVHDDQQRAPREGRQVLRIQPAVALPAAARRAEAPALHERWA